MNSKSPISSKQQSHGSKQRKLGKSHENPRSLVDAKTFQTKKSVLRSSQTDLQIDQTLDKLKISMQHQPASQSRYSGKKGVYTSDGKHDRRNFGTELCQNSPQEIKVGNFIAKTTRKSAAMVTSKSGSGAGEGHQAYTVTFQCPSDSGTIARFAQNSNETSSKQEVTRLELKPDSEDSAVLQQSDEGCTENRVTMTTPLDEVDFMLSRSQIATQQDEHGEMLQPSRSQLDVLKKQEADVDETAEHPHGTDLSNRTVPESPTKSFNCFAPVKPNRGQLPLMHQQSTEDQDDLQQRIMDHSGSGHQSSSLCQMHSPKQPKIHQSSHSVNNVSSANSRKYPLDKSAGEQAIASIRKSGASKAAPSQSPLWKRSSLQICHQDANAQRQSKVLQCVDLSQELRDIELGSGQEESLLFMDSSRSGDHFRTMKGLDHLAKLSSEENDQKTFRTERKAKFSNENHKSPLTSQRATLSPIELAGTPRQYKPEVTPDATLDKLGYLDDSDQPRHYATADAGPGKNPVADDLDMRSIPTDVELITNGNFDDLGIKLRQTQDDSRILSSIMHHESSHYQSQSALSMIQHHVKQIVVAQEHIKVEPFPQSARQETAESRQAHNHQGYLDKPISFGKDFATKDTLSSAQKNSQLFHKTAADAQSPALQSQPSPQFERTSIINPQAQPKAQPTAPKAPVFNLQLMKKIRSKIGTNGSTAKPNAPKANPAAKFVSVPVQPLKQVGEGSIFHQQRSEQNNQQTPSRPHDRQSLDDLLWTSIKKHFQKPAPASQTQYESTVQTTVLDQSSVCDDPKAPRRLENILNYQRSILVQTAILRNKLSPELYARIDHGDVHELQLDTLESFLSSYPKQNEVEALKVAIQKVGIFDFREALQKLECGSAEQFMLQVLSHESDLQQKAEILKQIIEMGPSINQLLTCISNWIQVREKLTKSEDFIEIVRLTYKFMSLVSADKFKAKSGGFDLRSLTKLFEVRSTLTKEKSAYHIILKQFLLRMDTQAGQRLLEAKDYLGFWKRLPVKIFDDTLVAQAKLLYPPQKLMGQLGQIQEAREQLESKVQLFSGKSEAERDFRDAIMDYLQFYDTQVKPELIHFTQGFKETVASLTEFLGLQTSDLLQETMASLLKYAVKHKDFVSKLVEHKRRKMRTMNAVISSKVQSSRSPQAVAFQSRRVMTSAKGKVAAGTSRLSSQPESQPQTAFSSRVSPRNRQAVPLNSQKQQSDSKQTPATSQGASTKTSAKKTTGNVTKTKMTPKQSPRASARAAQVISNQKPVGIKSALMEPKSTPSVKGSCRKIEKEFEHGSQQRETNRTSPSPEVGALSRQEKESIERKKIAQEEKRFTTYLKRHYSPNAPVPAGVKTARFDYLGKLQKDEMQRASQHESTSQETRPRVTVSVFSSHSARSQASGDKENYMAVSQKPYYSGEYSVPMTSSQVQKLKFKSTSAHSRSSNGGSRPWRAGEKTQQSCKVAENAAQDVQKAAQKITPQQFVRPFVAGTESSAERRGPENARVALEYFQTQMKTASMPKFFSPTQQKSQGKFAGIVNEKNNLVSQSVQGPNFRKGYSKVSPSARRPPQSSRPSSRQSISKHDQSVKSASVGASRECTSCKAHSTQRHSISNSTATATGAHSAHQSATSGAQGGSRKLLKRSEIQYANKK